MRFAGRFVLVHDLLGIDLVVVRVVGFMDIACSTLYRFNYCLYGCTEYNRVCTSTFKCDINAE